MLSVYQVQILPGLSPIWHFWGLEPVLATDVWGKYVIGVGIVGTFHGTPEIHAVACPHWTDFPGVPITPASGILFLHLLGGSFSLFKDHSPT